MKKLGTTRRLALKTETLRKLAKDELGRAIGGNGSIDYSCACLTGGYCLPPTSNCTDNCQVTGLRCV